MPSSGRLLFDNVPIEELDLRDLRRHLGFVLQRPYMFDATIAENISFGDEAPDHDEIRAAAETAGAHEFIARLPMGYATPIGEGGMVLSGGQVQRIAIARRSTDALRSCCSTRRRVRSTPSRSVR